MEALVQELKALSGAVAEYFCEDPASFRLDECCSIFHSFCKRFAAAVQVINAPLPSLLRAASPSKLIGPVFS